MSGYAFEPGKDRDGSFSEDHAPTAICGSALLNRCFLRAREVVYLRRCAEHPAQNASPNHFLYQRYALMSDKLTSASQNHWPAFDFMNLPLSQPARQQLSTIYRHTREGVGSTKHCQLLNLLRDNAFNVQRGVYVPVGDRVQIPGKLPVQSELFARKALAFPVEPLSVCFFSNTLVIPEGFGEPDFDPRSVLPPRDRLTNTGHLIATAEFDPDTTDQFEEM